LSYTREIGACPAKNGRRPELLQHPKSLCNHAQVCLFFFVFEIPLGIQASNFPPLISHFIQPKLRFPENRENIRVKIFSFGINLTCHLQN